MGQKQYLIVHQKQHVGCNKTTRHFFKTTRRFYQNNTSVSLKQHVDFGKTSGHF